MLKGLKKNMITYKISTDKWKLYKRNLELKSIVHDMKTLLNLLNRKLDKIKQRVSAHGDRSIDIMKSGEHKKKRLG